RDAQEDFVNGPAPPFVAALRELLHGRVERLNAVRTERRRPEIAEPREVEPTLNRREPAIVSLLVEQHVGAIHLPREHAREARLSLARALRRAQQISDGAGERVIAHLGGGRRAA